MNSRLALGALALLLFVSLASNANASNTWYVNGVHGGDSDDCKTRQTACKTIGHAVTLASSGDTILVAAATYPENLRIGVSVTIIGAGGRWAAIHAIIDGGGNGSTVTITSPLVSVTLARLKIRNGFAALGGGIFSAGSLTIYNSIISGNHGSPCGGGIFNSGGSMTIYNSTFSANIARRDSIGYGLGGAIYSYAGPVTLVNTTISENTAGTGYGGGYYNDEGTLNLNNTTVSLNQARSGARGGAIYNENGTVITQNSIIANSPSGPNCAGSTVTSKGYNLSSDSTCNLTQGSDQNNTDPTLGPLQNNGGPTRTLAPLPGSPAIDAGNPEGCTYGQGDELKTDQRGQPRQGNGRCDIGAYEVQDN